MWIFLGIVGALALIIAIILLLPVYVILKTDENGEFILRYKFLNKTYGENPDPNNVIIKTLKKAAGLSRLEKKQIKSNVKKAGVFDTIRESFDLLLDLLKRIVDLLKLCVIKKLKVKIVCAKEDAADTAISYGKYCAVVNPVLSYIHNFTKVRKRGRDVSITCDYNGGNEVFEVEIVLYVHVFRVLGALIRVVWQEAQRISDNRLKQDAARRKRAANQKRKK